MHTYTPSRFREGFLSRKELSFGFHKKCDIDDINKPLMKKSVAILGWLFVLCGCQSSHSYSKDLATGLHATSTEMKAKEVFLSDIQGNKLGSNQIHLGSTIKIIAEGVTGLTAENGRVYPGCSISVTGKAGSSILSIEDAFSDIVNGFDKDSATVLRATLSTGAPMIAGEKYQFRAVFFDKRKKGSEIKAEIELNMQ